MKVFDDIWTVTVTKTATQAPSGGASLIPGLILLGIICTLIVKYAYETNVAKIAGIPEMPSALPFIGHLHLHAGASGKHDGALWAEWSKKLGSVLIQVRFGKERVVVANSFRSIKEIFVTNSASSSGRPRRYIFEKYIGYDMGSHSLDETFKAQRTAALRSVRVSNWTNFYPCLDREGNRLIANLAEQGEYGGKPINPLPHMQVVTMALGWSITFDKEFGPNDPWLRRYIDNVSVMTRVRGGSNTWCDFVPLLRLHPRFRAMALEGREASRRRNGMIQEILQGLEERIARGERPRCVAGQVLTDPDSKLSLWNAIKCSMSMLQGGAESLPTHLTAGMQGLIQGQGFQVQEKAFAAILDAYPDGDAVNHAFDEEKVPYIVALYKEILRHYTVLPISLPHAANQDVHLKSGITIPKGTTLYMNSEAANHDEEVYGPTAQDFIPERWLENPDLDALWTVPYASYGIGSRICPAWQIANRIMYGMLVRIILAFKLEADPNNPPPSSYREYGCTPDLIINGPKPFGVRFVPRDTEDLKRRVADTRGRG